MQKKLIEQLEKLSKKKVILKEWSSTYTGKAKRQFVVGGPSNVHPFSNQPFNTIKKGQELRITKQTGSMGDLYQFDDAVTGQRLRSKWDIDLDKFIENKTILKEDIENKQETFKLDVTIETGDEEVMKDFVRMFSCMDWTKVGASRGLKLFLDGDGSFRADIKVNGKDISDAAEEILGKEDIEKTIDKFDREKLDLGFGA